MRPAPNRRPGGHGEGLRRTHGEATGAQSGSSFADANRSEHGNHPSPVPWPPAASRLAWTG
ncbi:hypothetical protein ATKI12_8477 [Kitasatospora sp. Ki12]